MSSHPELINRIAEISYAYDVVILSFMGIISDGENINLAAIDTMHRLRRENKKILILANHPARVEKLAFDLEKVGVTSDMYDGLLTSGEVVYHEMANKTSQFFRSLGNCYYYIGRECHRNDWINIGYIPVDEIESAEFIIVTGSENKYDMIERYLPVLRNAANLGLPMLCVNPDKGLLLGNSDDIGGGSIASRYQSMGGVVMLRGKPQNDMFLYCMEGFPGVEKNKFLMIANNYNSDVKGASDAGIDSVVVASGTHAREFGIALGKPISAQSVSEVSRHYGLFPKFVISELKY